MPAAAGGPDARPVTMDEQVEYFRKVLAHNADVRWTFVFMHSPAWWTQTGYEIDPGNFVHIEAALADRDYTVFAAHTHLYRHHERQGRDCVTAAMTDALQVPRLVPSTTSPG